MDSKVLFPKELFKIRYGKLGIDKKQIKTAQLNKDKNIPQLNAFSNSKGVTYVFNLEPEKSYFDLKICGGTFNFINSSGNLEINVKKNPEYLYWSYTSNPNASISDYPNDDYVAADNITINTEGHIHYSQNNYFSHNNSPLKSITFNCATGNILFNNLPELKKIVLNSSGKGMDRVYITKCPKLELLDISKSTYFNYSDLSLHDIPNNCKIKINPECKILSSVKSPLKNDKLKAIFEWDEKQDIESAILLSEILDIPSKPNPAELTIFEFKKRLLAFSNKRMSKLLQQGLEQEKEEMNFIEKNINLPQKEFEAKKHLTIKTK